MMLADQDTRCVGIVGSAVFAGFHFLNLHIFCARNFKQNLKAQPSGVARQLVTFSCFAKEKVTKKKATPVCRPLRGFPALLDWSGGCGTRTIRYAATCSNSPRRLPLTSLRYSAAHRGRKSKNLKPPRGHFVPILTSQRHHVRVTTNSVLQSSAGIHRPPH
jgi:hypothetical protein